MPFFSKKFQTMRNVTTIGHIKVVAALGIEILVVRQYFYFMQHTLGRIFCCDIRGHSNSTYPFMI